MFIVCWRSRVTDKIRPNSLDIRLGYTIYDVDVYPELALIGVRARGLPPPSPDSGKAIIFRAKAKFFGQNQEPKMEKYI